MYAWYSPAASFMIWPFAPENRGGVADYRPKIAAVVKESGRALSEVAEEVCLVDAKPYLVLIPWITDYIRYKR